jgi:hypothetical protein
MKREEVQKSLRTSSMGKRIPGGRIEPDTKDPLALIDLRDDGRFLRVLESLNFRWR